MAADDGPRRPEVLGFPGEPAEYFFEEGCYVLELSNSPADPALSIARIRLRPGDATRAHFLTGTAERYVILEGRGEVHVGSTEEEAAAVGPGDVVLIPAGCPQRIRNSGDRDLVFLALCTPRFEARRYHEPQPREARPGHSDP